MLSPDQAAAFARVALANIAREYPHKLDHLLTGPGEETHPRALHPAFFGSYDWHSAVHMHWTLARVWRRFPSEEVAAALDRSLAPAHLAAERAYFESPAGQSFERPYGWAWILKLQAELLGTRWASAVAPLAELLARRFARFFAQARYPIRAGTHGNTAFAGLLALDYARAVHDGALEAAIGAAARRWYGTDRDAPLAYEPSLDDFLSSALTEAALMQQVLDAKAFRDWLGGFLPAGIGPLAEPPTGFDRSDAKQAHLDGLSLSRAWCLRRLGFAEAAKRHLEAGLPQVVGGDYVGEHWLASFALLALTEDAPR